MSTLAPPRYIPALDGVRGIAVMMVVALHFVPITGIGDLRSLGRAINSVALLGGLGVDVFFVLSGFLITGILLQSKGSKHFFSYFYVRRALRIFPLYYLALFIAFVVMPLFVGTDDSVASENQAWLWLYGTNLLAGYSGDALVANGVALGHFWSLAVEEHFYLLWPAVIVLCRSANQVVRVAVIMIVVAFCARAIEMHHVGMKGVSVLTWCRFDSLAVGCCMAVAYESDTLWSKLQRPITLVGVGATVVFLALGFTTSYFNIAEPWALSLLWFPLQSLVGAGFLAFALGPGDHRILTHPILLWLGRRSYGIYVYHGMVKLAFAALVTYLVQSIGSKATVPVSLLVGLAATFAVAELSYRLVESPLNSLKRHFRDSD